MKKAAAGKNLRTEQGERVRCLVEIDEVKPGGRCVMQLEIEGRERRFKARETDAGLRPSGGSRSWRRKSGSCRNKKRSARSCRRVGKSLGETGKRVRTRELSQRFLKAEIERNRAGYLKKSQAREYGTSKQGSPNCKTAMLGRRMGGGISRAVF